MPELFNDSGIRMTSSRVDAIHENDPAIFTDYRAGQNNIITCSYLQRRGERIERIEREGGVVPMSAYASEDVLQQDADCYKCQDTADAETNCLP